MLQQCIAYDDGKACQDPDAMESESDGIREGGDADALSRWKQEAARRRSDASGGSTAGEGRFDLLVGVGCFLGGAVAACLLTAAVSRRH
jgi:hypothetical protein